MKRNTLILLLLAVIGGVAVYFLEIKPGKPRDTKPDESKPAFAFKGEDISSISINRAGQTVVLEKRDGTWSITQPVTAQANQSAVDSLVSSLTSARIERNISATADETKSFGLEEPAVTVEIGLASGETQTLKLGNKDFSGLSVYAKVGDANDVAMIPASVLTSADKSVGDLRDKAILGASQFDIKSISVSNENGQILLAKDSGDWAMKKPFDAPVESTELNSFLTEVTSAQAEEIAAENADDLAKYGLDKPKVTLSVQLNDGSERTIAAAAKDDNHYAKTSAKPQVFKISSSLYEKLNLKPTELRSKEILKLDRDNLSKIEIKNPNVRLIAEKSGDKWLIKEPPDKKDKDAPPFKIVNPFETRADEIIENPGADVRAKLAKPAVEARLTYKDGKVIEVKISSADGDDAYVAIKGRTEVFKVKKQMLDDLSFKAADL